MFWTAPEQMERHEKDLSKLLDTVQNLGGQFNIMENRVPVTQQLEYFEFARRLQKKKRKMSDSDFNQYKEKLANDTPREEKKKVLILLALSSEIRAYRLLEKYVQEAEDDLVHWASMALMESRMWIESELTEKKQVYISTGLGGKGEKLRFYALILAMNGTPFEDYQRKIIETEVECVFSKNDCEIERLTIKNDYVEFVFLMPLSVDLRKILQTLVMECNVYGNFLSPKFQATNVKEFNQDEVNQLLERNKKNRILNE